MQTITTQTSGIHCKVATQTNEVRRFLLLDKNYAALLEQICQVFGFKKDDVVIKYADEEGDFVTISSDEEVQFALVEIAKNCVLKLRVELRQPSAVQGLRTAVSEPAKNREKFVCEDEESSSETSSESDGAAKHWKPKCAEKKRDKWLFYMKKKREHLLAHIAEFESQATGEPKSQYKIEKMKNRVAHLTEHIQRFENQGPREPFHPSRGSWRSRGDFPRGDFPRGDFPCGHRPRGDLPCGDLPRGDFPQESSCPAPPLLSKDEILRQLDENYNAITGLRLALRQECLQIQLQRTNLRAVSHQRDNSGENAIPMAPAGPTASEEQIQQMKNALGQAKERKSAKKAELKSLVERSWALKRQLKGFRHHEEKGYKRECHNAKKHRRHCH